MTATLTAKTSQTAVLLLQEKHNEHGPVLDITVDQHC